MVHPDALLRDSGLCAVQCNNMTRFCAITLLFISLSLSACESCKPLDLKEEVRNMDTTERQALAELLNGTGLAVEALRPIGILGIDRNPKALAVEKGHVVGLRLSGVTVSDLGPVQRLPGLQVLWLTGCTLPSLAGLSGHGALRDLSLAGSGLASVEGLTNLPQLKELNLDDNKLRSVAGLVGVQALKKLSVRNNLLTEPPTLGTKVEVVLDGNPTAKAVAPEPAAEKSPTDAPASAVGSVTKLPKSKGKLTGNGPHQTEGSLLGRPLKASGIYDSLVGVVSLGFAEVETADPTVDAELSVETGRVRLYLEAQSRKSYLYAEATPGHPARLNGRMILEGTYYGVVYESLDGTATGLRYRVTGAGHNKWW